MKNVVIMGAGPAGLTAGLELQKKLPDCQITILEKSNEVGGLSRTVSYKGNKIDIGGHRYFSQNRAVIQWWNSILPIQSNDACVPFNCDRSIMMIRPRSSHIFFKGNLIHYPLKLDCDLFKSVGLFGSAKILLSFIHAKINKRDIKSLEDYYINQFGRRLYSIFFEQYTRKICGVTPDLISPDWGTQRVKGLSLPDIIRSIIGKRAPHNSAIEETITETFFFPPYGSGQMWDKVAERVLQGGGKILLNCEPTHITADGKTINGIVCSTPGTTLNLPADILISTIPVRELLNLLPCEPPASIRSIATGLQYRDFIMVGILIDKRRLPSLTRAESLLIRDNWVYVQNPDLHMSRIQIYNNWSPFMPKDSDNYLWLGAEFCCSKADAIWQSTDAEIVRLCLSELDQLGFFSDSTPDDACVIREEKAYPCYHGAYYQLDHLHTFLNQAFDNLYCLGRNGEHRYLNMDQVMEHAFDLISQIAF